MSAEVSIPGFGHNGNASVPVCHYRNFTTSTPLNPMWYRYTLYGPGRFSCAASEAAALSPAHLALCTFQSAIWQAASQYDATAHAEHFFSGMPVAPQDQQGFGFLTLRGVGALAGGCCSGRCSCCCCCSGFGGNASGCSGICLCLFWVDTVAAS